MDGKPVIAAASMVDADLLAESAALTQAQHHRLRQFASELDIAEDRALKALDVHLDEMQRLADENKALRINTANMTAELKAFDGTEYASELAFQELRQKLTDTETALFEREQQIQKVKPLISRLPRENEELARQRLELMKEVDDLRFRLSNCGPQMRLHEYQNQLDEVQQNLAARQSLLRSLNRTREDALAAEKTALALESENWEQSVALEHQQKELRRYHVLVDAMNREKALVPPTILALADLASVWGPEGRLRVLPEELKAITDRLDKLPEVLASVSQEVPLRGGLALQQMRMLEEYQRLMSDLVSGVSQTAAAARGKEMLALRGYFYVAPVLHALVDSSRTEKDIVQGPPGFLQRFLGIKAGEIVVCSTEKADIPIHILQAWKTSVALDKEQRYLILRYKSAEDALPETHVIKLSSADEFDRWFYALKYAGFLPPLDVTSYLTAPPPPVKEPPPRGPPRVLVICPKGLGPGGVRLPLCIEDGVCIFDAPSNKVNIRQDPDSGNLVSFNAQHTACIVNPATREFYLYYFDPKLPEVPPRKIVIKAKDDLDFKELLDSAIRMKWKQLLFGPDRSLTLQPRPKPVKKAAPPPPVEDLFIVENKQLKLLEHAGAKEPVLVLEAEHCVTTANDTTREFVIVFHEETPEEETYVFTFDDEEIYRKKKQQLIDNDFFLRKRKIVRDFDKRVNQVCVVQKGRMDMYQHYGSPGDKPIMTMYEGTTSALALRERKEIVLVNQKKDGKQERAVLDCSTMKEFDRWYIALLFGGFLKEVTDEDRERLKSLSQLTKYIFPISLFVPQQEEGPRCVRVTPDAIEVYPTREAKTPLFVFKKAVTTVISELENRRFRILRHRYTPEEDRCDVVMHLASEFDRLKEELEVEGYLKEKPRTQAPLLGVAQRRFILARKLLLNIYPTRQATRPVAVLRSQDYIGVLLSKDGGGTVTLRPRRHGEENKTAEALAELDAGIEATPVEKRLQLPSYTFSVKSRPVFDRWRFAFFIARMEEAPVELPRFFLPNFVFGFSSEEFPVIEESKTKPTSRSSFLSLRRGSKSRHGPPQDVLRRDSGKGGLKRQPSATRTHGVPIQSDSMGPLTKTRSFNQPLTSPRGAPPSTKKPSSMQGKNVPKFRRDPRVTASRLSRLGSSRAASAPTVGPNTARHSPSEKRSVKATSRSQHTLSSVQHKRTAAQDPTTVMPCSRGLSNLTTTGNARQDTCEDDRAPRASADNVFIFPPQEKSFLRRLKTALRRSDKQRTLSRAWTSDSFWD